MAERGGLAAATVTELPTGTRLTRVHLSTFGAAQFNPCMGDPTRFAPIRVHGRCVPSLYAATDLRAALAETVLHDVDVADPYASIPRRTLTARSVSVVQTARPLHLISLFRLEMGMMGLTHEDHFNFSAQANARCRALAAALYQAHPQADGLIWTSQRDDSQRACLLFGDRVDAALSPQTEEALIRMGPAMDSVLQLLDGLQIDLT